MFKSVKEQDSFKNTQTHYYLTQGDSCVITSTPYRNGELVSTGEIEQCMFKLATSDYKLKFSKQMTVSPNGSYVLTLTSDETETLNAGSYVYEIEYTIDGEDYTPHSWKFDIVKQITE